MRKLLASLAVAAAIVPSFAAAAPVLVPTSPIYKVDLCKFSVSLTGGASTIGVLGKPICSVPADKFEIPFPSSLLCSGKTVIKNKLGVVKTPQFVAANCVAAL